MRVVLVEWPEGVWRTFRQPQWIGQVRARPGLADLPRRHFEIGADAYRACLAAWDSAGAGADGTVAARVLGRLGAVEIAPPPTG